MGVLEETALCRLVTASFYNLFSTVNFMWISSSFLRGFVVLAFCLVFWTAKVLPRILVFHISMCFWVRRCGRSKLAVLFYIYFKYKL